MLLYRIADKTYSHDLSGRGAQLYGGRWNPAGIFAIYAATSISLATLEKLVHVGSMNALPDSPWLDLITYHLPDDLPIEVVEAESLPADWISYPPSPITIDVGQDWAAREESVGLVVPSVLFPEAPEKNVLLNPRHPEFPQVAIHDISPFPKDTRLQKYFVAE